MHTARAHAVLLGLGLLAVAHAAGRCEGEFELYDVETGQCLDNCGVELLGGHYLPDATCTNLVQVQKKMAANSLSLQSVCDDPLTHCWGAGEVRRVLLREPAAAGCEHAGLHEPEPGVHAVRRVLLRPERGARPQ